MKRKFVPLGLLLLTCVLASGCGGPHQPFPEGIKEVSAAGATEADIYVEMQRKVFGPRCARCHSPGQSMAHRNWMDEITAREFAARMYTKVCENRSMPAVGDKIDLWPEDVQDTFLAWLEDNEVEHDPGRCRN